MSSAPSSQLCSARLFRFVIPSLRPISLPEDTSRPPLSIIVHVLIPRQPTRVRPTSLPPSVVPPRRPLSSPLARLVLAFLVYPPRQSFSSTVPPTNGLILRASVFAPHDGDGNQWRRLLTPAPPRVALAAVLRTPPSSVIATAATRSKTSLRLWRLPVTGASSHARTLLALTGEADAHPSSSLDSCQRTVRPPVARCKTTRIRPPLPVRPALAVVGLKLSAYPPRASRAPIPRCSYLRPCRIFHRTPPVTLVRRSSRRLPPLIAHRQGLNQRDAGAASGHWSLIDLSTPKDAYTIPSYHDPSKRMKLVFSDEFETDGRSFYPGDDPYWEAVSLHYWQTGDLDWYDPSTITTKNGALEITLTKVDNILLNYNLSYRSASSPLSPSSLSLPLPPSPLLSPSHLRCPERELPHKRLARQQEEATRLATLTTLPPSPTLSQEERDEALAHHCGPGDVAGLAQTWLTIHLSDLSPFLLSPIHSRLNAYYDFYGFRIGRWVAIPRACAFDVVTDEPILLRHIATVANNEDEDIIASYSLYLPELQILRVLPDDADVDTLDILAYVHQVSHSAIMCETLLEIAYTSESFKS
ncbi:beta-glucan synthesis-associated protein-domain-containing protein [Mycena olivaceomarginata]|nr:beta-glucan synthesis-associated protein-domain-containing protein [Mycena olivaceomarginata]